jgi:hypothetical protein
MAFSAARKRRPLQRLVGQHRRFEVLPKRLHPAREFAPGRRTITPPLSSERPSVRFHSVDHAIEDQPFLS